MHKYPLTDTDTHAIHFCATDPIRDISTAAPTKPGGINQKTWKMYQSVICPQFLLANPNSGRCLENFPASLFEPTCTTTYSSNNLDNIHSFLHSRAERMSSSIPAASPFVRLTGWRRRRSRSPLTCWSGGHASRGNRKCHRKGRRPSEDPHCQPRDSERMFIARKL